MFLHVLRWSMENNYMYLFTLLQIQKKSVQICLIVIMYATFTITNLNNFNCFNFRL